MVQDVCKICTYSIINFATFLADYFQWLFLKKPLPVERRELLLRCDSTHNVLCHKMKSLIRVFCRINYIKVFIPDSFRKSFSHELT